MILLLLIFSALVRQCMVQGLLQNIGIHSTGSGLRVCGLGKSRRFRIQGMWVKGSRFRERDVKLLLQGVFRNSGS